MGLYIDITHYHILQSHSRYCYDLFCNHKLKKVNYLKLIWVYSPEKWHSKQLKFASPYVACDLSVWEVESSTVLCMWSCLWNLAVQCYNWFSISVLRNLERKFAISKAQCLHGMCACLHLYVHDHIRCIVKVCVSQLFWCREVIYT